ncbi:MAG: cation transporting ATPase C-terminal domain-containing protein, partial [Clostridiales bacterium]|nr:cation transporting ATPase C-terminal domain-containing protein [Clostridiales bacterium]
VEYTDEAPNYGKRCSMLLRFAVISTALYGRNKLSSAGLDPDAVHTAEETAIVAQAEKHKLYNVALDRDYPILDHMSAGGPSRFETSLVGNFAVENLGNGIDGISDDSRPHKEGEDYLVCCRGELTAILSRCRTYTQNGAMVPLDTAASTEIRASALARGRAAYRVVGIATKTTADNDLTRIENLQSDLNFEGFLAIREPILPGAARNMSKLRAAGVNVIMLCDDLSENNLQIAKTVGIASNSTDVMQSKQMDKISDGMLRTNIRSYRVYEALRLEQKKKLIDFLRAEGETVMFMGGKLDEIGLMREADVGAAKSVAISIKGARGDLRRGRGETEYIRAGGDPKLGCEALKFAADVIVSESDDEGNGSFNAIVGAISSAKVIYQNILRMVRYLITSQLARLFIVLYSVVVRYEMMSPAQIIFTGLIVDFAAVMIIAFERPSHDILRSEENTSGSLTRPLAHNVTCVAFGLFWAGAAVAAPLLADSTVFALEPAQTGSAVFIGFLLAQAVVLSETMKSRSVFMPNVKFNFIYAGVIAALIAFVAVSMLTPLGASFGITALPAAGWLCAVIPPLVLLLVYEIYKILYSVYLSARRWKEKREM